MELRCVSNRLSDYLEASEEVDFRHPAIHELTKAWLDPSLTELQRVKQVFEYVRDEISHSWDIQSTRVTRTASEVLEFREGICYAKSNLLAALLRSLGIPAGFCYQRLTLGDLPETGYCIHALNAVYLTSLNKWVRLDARGNNEFVDAQFSIQEEKLAFPVRVHFGEIDYEHIYSKSNPETMEVLKRHDNCLTMYRSGLPTELKLK